MAGYPKLRGGCCAAGCSEGYLPFGWTILAPTNVWTNQGAYFNQDMICPYFEGPDPGPYHSCHWQSELDNGYQAHVYKVYQDTDQTHFIFVVELKWTSDRVDFNLARPSPASCNNLTIPNRVNYPAWLDWGGPSAVEIRASTVAELGW